MPETLRGPTLTELLREALSSTEHGYDLLAPKFDRTPFRTPEAVLDATARTLRSALGADGAPFRRGLDLCCGTGAGLRVVREFCAEPPVGVDFSAGMLGRARAADQEARLVRADARALPFRPESFDLAVSFGAFGHFLPGERLPLFQELLTVLRPGGVFAFPLGRFPRFGTLPYWQLTAFDAAMRVRNAVWRPQFVMYYRTFRPAPVRATLREAGFTVRAVPLLPAAGSGAAGSGGPIPDAVLVLAERANSWPTPAFLTTDHTQPPRRPSATGS